MSEKYMAQSALIKTIDENAEFFGCFGDNEISASELMRCIELTPPADVRPVICCKDCDWWTKLKDSAQGHCALHHAITTGTWFCGDAIPKGAKDA